MKKEALRVYCVVPTTPHAVYSAWIDSAQHSAFTGSKAVIDSDVGGKFTAWDGYISGKSIQLDLGRRIIQSWRTSEFPKGAPDSRLEIHFERVFDGTRILILHSDIPEGQGEKYKSGWVSNYFQPMRAYFGKMALKADRASMVRMQQRASQANIDFADDEEEADEKPAKGKAGKAAAAPPVKPAAAKSEKAAAPTKPEKISKPEKPSKAEKPAKVAKEAPASKSKKPEKVAAPAKAAKPSKSDKKKDKGEKKAQRPDKPKAKKSDKKAAKPSKDDKKKDKKGKKKR